MTIENKSKHSINRIALLYRDLLSSNMKPLSNSDKKVLLNIQPNNKIIAIGDVEGSNWNAYPLTWLLDRKLVAPTVLDESKIYQSMHAMRVHDTSIIHPQNLISQSVVIRIVGFDNSANINDYINSFINMCIASDECKVIFIVVACDKKTYKNSIYIRKSNSTFIDTSKGTPYQIEGSALCVKPDDIVFFTKIKSAKTIPQAGDVTVISTITSRKKNSLSSMINDSDMF